MSRAWATGSTRRWRTIRAYVLQRDQYRCQLKLDGCTTRANEAHHTLGREVIGDKPDDLVAACSNCNKKTGDPRSHDPKPRPRTQW